MTLTPLQLSLLPSFVAAVLFVAPTPAQATSSEADEFLVVEAREDLAARGKFLALLRATRVSVNLTDASVSEVVEYLHAATARKINIFVSSKTKAADLPKVTLQLKKVRLDNLMRIYQEQVGLQFTFRSGVVFLKPKEAVKPLAYLQIYDVRAAVMKVPEFIGPKLGLRSPDDESGFTGGTTGDPVSVTGLDGDRLVELIRSMAVSDSWDEEGRSVAEFNGVLLIRQTVAGHRAVRSLLVKLGAIPKIRRVVASPRSPSLRSLPTRARTARPRR